MEMETMETPHTGDVKMGTLLMHNCVENNWGLGVVLARTSLTSETLVETRVLDSLPEMNEKSSMKEPK